MKKIKFKTLSLVLIMCFIVPYFAIVATNLINNNNNSGTGNGGGGRSTTTPSVSSVISDNYKTNYISNVSSSNYRASNTSTNVSSVSINEFAEGDLYNYTASSNVSNKATTSVLLKEKLLLNGDLLEYLYVDGAVKGFIKYNDENYISSVEIDTTSIYYDREEDGRIESLVVGEDYYEYNYSGDNISSITLNDELFSKFEYENHNRVQKESYSSLQRRYEHSLTHTIEYYFDAQTDVSVVSKEINLLETEPYTDLVRETKTYGGKNHVVITSLTYEGKVLNLSYDYVYNNVPYITKAEYNGKSVYYNYVNDLLVSESYDNVLITYVYSSTNQLVAVVYGKIINGEFTTSIMPVVTDAFGNIIQVKYTNLYGNEDDYDAYSDTALSVYYNSYGKKINQSKLLENFNISLGYRSMLQFDEFNLNYKNGSLYSSITGINLNTESTEVEVRTFKIDQTKRKDVSYSTLITGIINETLKNYFVEVQNTSVTDQAFVIGEKDLVYDVDLYTNSALLAIENIGSDDSTVYNITNVKDTVKRARLTQVANELKESKSAFYLNVYPASSGESDIKLQFIFLNKLFKVYKLEDGILAYEEISGFSKSNYYSNLNLINYDTNRYVQYYQPTSNKQQFFSQMDLEYHIEGNSEESVTNFFKSLNYIDSSYSELVTDADYGSNTESVRNALRNTFTLNVPNYNPEKEYITVNENGDFIVENIPSDAGGEHVIDSKEIWGGVGLIVPGVMAIVSAAGVLLAVPTCGASVAVTSIVLAGISMVAGTLVVVTGVLVISNELQAEGSWIVNNLFNGDIELVKTIGRISLIVASVAQIAGGLLKTFAKCFTAGTPIITANGVRNIEDIKVGDYVLSYNELTGQQSYNKVVQTFERKVDKLVHITYNNITIETTEDHPFRIGENWVAAKDIISGTQLTTASKDIAIVTNVEFVDAPNTTVYNFEVENDHTYYVHDGILVHNSCVPRPTAEDVAKHTVKEIADSPEYKSAVKIVTEKLKNLNLHWKDGKIRREIWKEFASQVEDSVTFDRDLILNISKVAKKGNAPIVKTLNMKTGLIEKLRVDLHHVYGKYNTAVPNSMFRVVPMAQPNHVLFHKTFGYSYTQFSLPFP